MPIRFLGRLKTDLFTCWLNFAFASYLQMVENTILPHDRRFCGQCLYFI
jgi:hypothetical protein